jgi:alkanesulfonate monooxygenase SsuD/methylene tetrahydromethanopterin reductase-like flavin-dependent oxidoreductase (luciferase family)
MQEEHSTSVGRTTSGTAADVAELCRRAEATGADSIWAVDHLFWPHPLDEAMMRLAIAASATRRATLGTCVLQLPLRQPAEVAKQATALQLLSGGRFVLGLGVGSHEGEYVQAGVDYNRRGELMDAGIAEMREAWATGADADAETRYRQLPGSPPVPIWIGGASEAARRRAAAVADGWVPLFVTADEYGPALQALREETVKAGRPADAVEPAVVVFAHVGPEGEAQEKGCRWLSDLYGIPTKAFERHLVAGPSEVCAAGLTRFVQAGARHIVVMVAASNAVEHFGFLRSAFVAHAESPLSGVPA